MALRCTVCDHPKIVAINSALANGSGSTRVIAGQYGLSKSAVIRHAADHLPKVLERAAQRQLAKSDDQFMDAIQMLMGESAQYVADAHGAVKVQRVGENVYREYRDVGAMAGAINAARGVAELLGNATGRLNQPQGAAGATNVYLSVVLPRGDQLEQPAIEVQALPAADPDTTKD